VRTFEQMRKYVLVFLVCTLSVTVLLKVGEIQYLELILAADFLVLCILFFRNGLRSQVFQPFFSIGSTWGIFLILAFLLGVVALRQNFYSFNDTLLKRPLLVTIARMAELFLDVFYMLYLASLYREDEKLGRLGARTYYWMGVAGGVYAVVCFPLNFFFNMQLGTSSDSHRLRGFNNEAGSYGTYLIGVCLLTMAMQRRGWLSRNEVRFGMGLFCVCLLGSQSKAAILAVGLLGFINFLFLSSGWRRLTLIGVVGVGLAVVFSLFNFQNAINAYAEGAARYQNLSMVKSEDGNYVMGRVSGLVLSPRMMAAHPLLGIGWGNYPLVRDDPEYRRGTAFSLASTDSPSLGPIDYIVELGFPLFLYLTWAELKPLYLLWKHRADIWILNMAAMQILANWFGAHLNLTYQWVVVGLALGMGFAKTRSEDVPQRTIAT
jgi:O-Antigen ligase